MDASIPVTQWSVLGGSQKEASSVEYLSRISQQNLVVPITYESSSSSQNGKPLSKLSFGWHTSLGGACTFGRAAERQD